MKHRINRWNSAQKNATLGQAHNCSTTTKIYSHKLTISNKNVVSPLDSLSEILNLTGKTMQKS
ncbi:hypothetical protein Q4534_21645 [Cyclobacterium sp. 1_MG-2023]|uniref:hypothetical protein n=1 Tax=Cyclobacterium sp. 1_MG-2023 TaxID=3062681 RepID=UPI0026E3638B|nr:hypothetical protein [Cyclobacterium sp. 1_MG-2023]MDO6440046.1 hypothetical protein [Cyclobacterium sp. 1_MG-2023]